MTGSRKIARYRKIEGSPKIARCRKMREIKLRKKKKINTYQILFNYFLFNYYYFLKF